MSAIKQDLKAKAGQRKMSSIEAQKMKEIMNDPVKWAQVFVTIFDNVKKEYTPWCARWYQGEMLRDRSIKKVARCGRRTGKTETMCIEMLWKAFTKPHHRILVVTPYETQVRLIFTRLTELLTESPMLKKEVKRQTKNPYWIEFKNGAIILGFTTGASSGSGAASIKQYLLVLIKIFMVYKILCSKNNAYECKIESFAKCLVLAQYIYQDADIALKRKYLLAKQLLNIDCPLLK